MRCRRIVITSIWPYPHVGGVSTHIELVESGLRRRGYDVRLATGTQFSVYHQRNQAPGVVRMLRGLMLTARRYLDGYPRPDVTSAHDVIALLAAVRAGHRPAVLTLHGYLAYEYASAGAVTPTDPEFAQLLDLEREALTAADAVIAVDNRLVAHARSMGARNVHRLCNAVSLEDFPNPARPPEGPPYIVLCPRRLTAKNGVSVALEAARICEDRSPRTFRWVIAGGGEQEQYLKQLASSWRLESVVAFVGAIPRRELLPWYSRAFAVVVPSVPISGVEEATSLAVLEGMAAARPVVASRVGGLPELIKDGEDGVLVPPGDAHALAEALLYLAGHPLEACSIGMHGRQRVELEHSTDTWLARYENILREGIGCRGGRGGEQPGGTTASPSTLSSNVWLPAATRSLDVFAVRAARSAAADGGRRMPRMRCVFLAVHDRLTGGALVFFEHAERLRERGHDVCILAPCQRPNWMRSNVSWVEVPDLELNRLVSSGDAWDVAIGMFWTAVPALLKVPAKVRILLEQGDPALFEPELFPRALIEFMGECYRAPICLFSVSRFLQTVLERDYGRKSNVIPNGVDLGVFRPMPVLKGNGPPRVLVVGDERVRFKGLGEVFDALRLVRERVPELEVWHVTPSGVSSHDLPRVFFVSPSREELATLYAAADVFVSGSWYEGFALPPLEAMACGTAVVTTASGGVGEYAIDGHNCLMVPPKDVDALARAIEEVLTDRGLRSRLAANGVRTAAQHGWERAVDSLEQHVYGLLLAQEGTGMLVQAGSDCWGRACSAESRV